MQRISTSSAVPDLFGSGKNGFRNGDLPRGVLPTAFNAEWCNGVQEEICNVIEAAGIGLNPDKRDQLLEAIKMVLRGYLPLTGGTINGGLTVQAANAQYAGIHINNTDTGALGSFLGLDVGGLMRGGVEIFGEGEGSYSVALTATAKGDGSDRHERVLSAAAGYVWTRAYGLLHNYFARKTDLTNQINNLRSEINGKFTHSNYPSHYAGAEVWRMPNGLKITTMRIDGINASGDYYLPEAYQGRAIAVANDVGDGRRVVSSYLHPNSNRVTVFVNNLNVSVNIIVIGWANH